MVRCSTNEQADTSTEDQRQLLNVFAKDNEMIHAGEDIVLDGVTGSVPGARSDIDAIIRRKAERDDFDVLLVQDSSRLTRSGPDHGGHVRHVLAAAGIEVACAAEIMTGDPEQDALFQSLAFYAGQKHVRSISYACTRGQMSSIEAGKIPHASRVPYGVDRLYLDLSGNPRHIIRNLTDGTQQKLHPDTHEVLATFGKNPRKGAPLHYRRQSNERIIFVPGDPKQIEIVRQIYRWNLLGGLGAHRIARQLNDQGVPSPSGRLWQTSSVELILDSTTYTGIGITNRLATGIYNLRSKGKAPIVLRPDVQALSTHAKPPARLRPKEDWLTTEHPQMVDFLGEELRELALQRHQRRLALQAAKAADPKRKHKRGGDSHADSPFFLKGILHSKQGGFPMTGRTSRNSRAKKYRYYAVSRGANVPKKGQALARMIAAAPIEAAVLGAIQEALADTPNLRERIHHAVCQRTQNVEVDRQQLASLRTEQDELRQKIVAMASLGPAAHRLIQEQAHQWEAQIASLEERISKVQSSPLKPAVDDAALVERTVRQLTQLAQSLRDMPPAVLHGLLATMIGRLEVDLETLAVEMELVLPSAAATGAAQGGGTSPICLVSTSRRESRNQANWPDSLPIASFRCQGERRHTQPMCFTCSRRAA